MIRSLPFGLSMTDLFCSALMVVLVYLYFRFVKLDFSFENIERRFAENGDLFYRLAKFGSIGTFVAGMVLSYSCSAHIHNFSFLWALSFSTIAAFLVYGFAVFMVAVNRFFAMILSPTSVLPAGHVVLVPSQSSFQSAFLPVLTSPPRSRLA